MSEAKDLATAVRAVRRILGGDVVAQEENDTPATGTEKTSERGVESLF
jgi:hypothetical protein